MCACFVHLGHDIADVELRRLLAGRESFERPHESGHDLLDGSYRKCAALNPPAVVIIRVGVGTFERVAAQVEQLREAQPLRVRTTTSTIK